MIYLYVGDRGPENIGGREGRQEDGEILDLHIEVSSSTVGNGVNVASIWKTECTGTAWPLFNEDETILYMISSARVLEFGLRGDC